MALAPAANTTAPIVVVTSVATSATATAAATVATSAVTAAAWNPVPFFLPVKRGGKWELRLI